MEVRLEHHRAAPSRISRSNQAQWVDAPAWRNRRHCHTPPCENGYSRAATPVRTIQSREAPIVGERCHVSRLSLLSCDNSIGALLETNSHLTGKQHCNLLSDCWTNAILSKVHLQPHPPDTLRAWRSGLGHKKLEAAHRPAQHLLRDGC